MKRRMMLVTVCLVLLVSMLAAPVSASAAKSDISRVMKINVDGARLRSGPGNYGWSVTLKKGTKVIVGKKTNAFYHVLTSNGQQGYIYKGFLTGYGAVNKSQVYATTKAIGVHKKPSSKSKVVKKLKAGQYVLVYAVNGSWAYVKTLSGKGGYVKASALVKA